MGNDLENVSGYIFNHGSPIGELDTVSPRGPQGVAMGNVISVTRAWSIHI